MRAASGAVYVALVLGAAWLGAWATWILFLIVLLLAVKEWHALDRRVGAGAFPEHLALTAAWLAYMASAPLWLPTTDVLIARLLLAAAAAAYLAYGVARSPARGSALRFALLTVAWLALPMACAPHLVRTGPALFVGFMLLLWTNDTGAYLVGKAIGRRKLMPRVSPGKTWEGFIGGMLLTLLLAWPISRLSNALPLPGWLIAAAGVAIASTIGDLWESALKRKAGVKDSGRIMPGHGGALDRFDGYLLAAPVMLLVVLLMRL